MCVRAHACVCVSDDDSEHVHRPHVYTLDLVLTIVLAILDMLEMVTIALETY